MPMIVKGLKGGPALNQTIGQWVKQNAIAIGEKTLREQVRRGFDPQPVVITDGVPRRDHHLVKPFGKFEFVAQTDIAEAVLWALGELVRRSPIGPAEGGHYKDDHVVMINGEQITGNIRLALRNVRPTDRVQIVNPRVYARKIESATTSKRTGRQRRRALSRQARAGVYRPVLRALVQRYSRTMFFDFKYVPLNLGVKVWGKQGGNSNLRVRRDQVYPAIQFFKKH